MKCCFRCGHYFAHKSNLNRHLTRKLPCDALYLDINGNDILNDFMYYKHLFQQLVKEKNITEFIDNIPEIELSKPKLELKDTNEKSDNNIIPKINTQKINLDNGSDNEELFELNNSDMSYKCEGCKQKFKYKNNYYRHRKSYCNVLKDEYKELKKHKKNLDKKYRTLKKEHQNKHDNQINNQINKQETNKKELNNIVNTDYQINDDSSNSHNQFQNSLNNYNTNAHNFQLKQGTQDIINQNEYHITINDYGNENINNISNREWKQIVKKLYQALPDLVKKVHFDMESNRNVYVPNIREKYAMVWKNGDWEIMDIRDVLNDLLVNNTDRIYEFLEENGEYLDNTLHTKMNGVIEHIGNSKKLQKEYLKQIKTILIGNRSIVKESYEAESGKKLEIR